MKLAKVPVRSTGIVILLFAPFVMGCSESPVLRGRELPAPSSQTTATAPASGAPAADPALRQPELAEAVDIENLPAHTGNLLLNGSFEFRTAGGVPESWSISPGTGLVPERRSNDTPYDKNEFVLLRGLKRAGPTMTQEFTLPDSWFGRKLRLAAFGKSPQAHRMVLAMDYHDGKSWSEIRKGAWPLAEEQWVELVLDVNVPAEKKAGKFRVRVAVPNTPNVGYQVDAVSLTMDIIPNASFENVDGQGRPQGWAIVGTRAESPDGRLKPHHGARYLAFASSADTYATTVGLIQLLKEDLGKELVVSGWGRAPADFFARFQVECMVNGVKRRLIDEQASWWPASPNAWKPFVATMRIPPDADPASFRLIVSTRKEAGQTLFVDDFAATVR